MSDQSFSIFDYLYQEVGYTFYVSKLTKTSLIHVSHTLEDIVLNNHLDALIFTGFQNSAHWETEATRYRQLADLNTQIYICAERPFHPESYPNIVHFELAPDDLLEQEWFLIIYASRFSVLLCGREQLSTNTPGSTREFDTFISFDNDIILKVLRKLEGVIERYRPELVTDFQQKLFSLQPVSVDINHVTHFSMEMIHFHEKLNKRLTRTYRSLQAQQRLNDLLIELSPAFIGAFDQKSNLIAVNQTLLVFLQPDEQIELSGAIGLIPVENLHIDLLHRERLSSERDTWESQLMNSRGEKIIVEWRTRQIELDYQKLWLAVGFDVTEQRTIQESLIRSEAHFREVVISIPQYVYVLELYPDDQSIQTYASPQIQKLTGYTAREIMVSFDFWPHRVIHPEDQERAREQFHLLERGESGTTDYRIITSSGEIKWVRDSAHAIENEETSGYTVYGVIDDITERKNAETLKLQQEKLRLELEQQRGFNELQNKLMTTISHEFRTPLTAILSSVEIMSRYKNHLNAEDQDRRLDFIQDQIIHMRTMLDDISNVLRVQKNEISFEPRNVELKGFIQNVIEETQQIFMPAQNFESEFNDLPPYARIDPRLVQQALKNLLANAIAYSPPESKIVIRASQNSRHLMLSVINEGNGIYPEDLPYIFDAFYRSKTNENITGTGLGLKIVKDYISLHQGTVTCVSEPEKTTTFTIQLPIIEDSP